MKRFLRSTAGKTVLFFLCLLSLAVTGISAMGIFLKSLSSGTEEWEYFSGTSSVYFNLLGIGKVFFWTVCIASLLIGLLSFIMLMNVTARRPGDDELHPGPLFRVPYELFLVPALLLMAGIAFGYILLNDEPAFLSDEMMDIRFALSVLVFIAEGAVLLGICVGTAGRIKAGTFFKNTLICLLLALLLRILKLPWKGLKKLHAANIRIIRSIPLIWKTVLLLLVNTLVDVVLVLLCLDGWDPEVSAVLLILKKCMEIPLVLYIASCLARLKKDAGYLSKGDITHVSDTRGLFLDLKEHAENLNSIASGMSIAVEERLKSERMKTELITNVSHDLKTPLTSVINYTQLIANEDTDNERIREYSGVLLTQAGRLKRLIEDLVEASKASTGNLDVRLTPCDAAMFLTQAAGEYEDKLKSADLSLIIRAAEEPCTILADGRRMWRVFDNLMNNICKYAKEGTRVYLTLQKEDGNAVFSFKNISRDELDVSEEELMERFVRGDASRNTEGNGLGLSIARSMAELQGGKLEIGIDGDLFKAVLTVPLYTEAFTEKASNEEMIPEKEETAHADPAPRYVYAAAEPKKKTTREGKKSWRSSV